MRRWFRDEFEAFVMLSPVPWWRFIAREGLILLGFIGLGLTIAYICCENMGNRYVRGRVGDSYRHYRSDVDWKTYKTDYFGRPIWAVTTEESPIPPDMDWFHFFFPFPGIDPGIYTGYRDFQRHIEEITRGIRKIQHRFVFNKPFVPPDREWVYFFAVEDKSRNIHIDKPLIFSEYLPDTSHDITASIGYDSVLLTYREIPGAKLVWFLSPQKRDEKNSMKITDVIVKIRRPTKPYPIYVRRKWEYRIILAYLAYAGLAYAGLAYAGFWCIRLIVLSVIQLRRRENSSG